MRSLPFYYMFQYIQVDNKWLLITKIKSNSTCFLKNHYRNDMWKANCIYENSFLQLLLHPGMTTRKILNRTGILAIKMTSRSMRITEHRKIKRWQSLQDGESIVMAYKTLRNRAVVYWFNIIFLCVDSSSHFLFTVSI